jgi:hypothetical protein
VKMDRTVWLDQRDQLEIKECLVLPELRVKWEITAKRGLLGQPVSRARLDLLVLRVGMEYQGHQVRKEDRETRDNQVFRAYQECQERMGHMACAGRLDQKERKASPDCKEVLVLVVPTDQKDQREIQVHLGFREILAKRADRE